MMTGAYSHKASQ